MVSLRIRLASCGALLALIVAAQAQRQPVGGTIGGPKPPGISGGRIGPPVPVNPIGRPLPGIPGQGGWFNRNRCWTNWQAGYGYGFSSVQYAVPAYYGAYPSYGYDLYSAALEQRNFDLQNQLNQAAAANRQLQDNLQRERNRVQVPLRRKRDDDRAAQERDKNLETKAKQFATAGNRLFAAGLYAKAAERYRDAIRADADDASNYFLLAQAHFAAKQYADASRALKDGLKLNPDWIENDFDLRTMYANTEQMTPQLAEIARAVKVNPLDRDAFFLLGFELFMSGQKEKARAILEQAARLEVDDRHLKPFFDYFEKQANAN